MSTVGKVYIHPLFLFSLLDHHRRSSHTSKKRIVGVITGENSAGSIRALNSFAVPFEEGAEKSNVWFFDVSYMENMFCMLKKTNISENIVGWYSTSSQLLDSDMSIQEILGDFCEDPVLVTCVLPSKNSGPLFHCYVSRASNSLKTQKVFEDIPIEMCVSEVEEVGITHLFKNVSLRNITHQILSKVRGIRELSRKIKVVQNYLGIILDGKIPPNEEIIHAIEDIVRMLPFLKFDCPISNLRAKAYDAMIMIHLSSVASSVVALHQMIDELTQHP